MILLLPLHSWISRALWSSLTFISYMKERCAWRRLNGGEKSLLLFRRLLLRPNQIRHSRSLFLRVLLTMRNRVCGKREVIGERGNYLMSCHISFLFGAIVSFISSCFIFMSELYLYHANSNYSRLISISLNSRF